MFCYLYCMQLNINEDITTNLLSVFLKGKHTKLTHKFNQFRRLNTYIVITDLFSHGILQWSTK